MSEFGPSSAEETDEQKLERTARQLQEATKRIGEGEPLGPDHARVVEEYMAARGAVDPDLPQRTPEEIAALVAELDLEAAKSSDITEHLNAAGRRDVKSKEDGGSAEH